MDTGDIAATVDRLRGAFEAGITKPYAWRMRQLRALLALLIDHEAEFADALRRDLGKAATESQITELAIVTGEIRCALRRLRRWLRPRRVAVPAVVMPARAWVVREPLGVCAVIAPWNYPVQLLLAPLVGALAAGNAVVLKPSELAPATAELMARLIPRRLDARAIAVVTGAAEATEGILAQRLDHVFYTGGAAVGRIVMAAAARTLTPVTLELGGKSPVFLDDTVDPTVAARRIAWGKFINAGQTCVAPDYVLATPAAADRLESLIAEAIVRFYGADPRTSADYGRIVTTRHFDRLAALLGEGRPVTGGVADRDERYIAPTVLADVPRDSPVMAEEIFGPILPIIRVAGVDDAVEFIRSRDRPLSLYVFSSDARTRRRILTGTSSGAVGFGVPAAHLAVPGLPFGGVGASGMGSYHGERSLVAFSHEKAVLDKPLSPDTMALVYPPYTALKRSVLRRVMR